MHPCRTCGACCAAFTVRFPAREVAEFGVPGVLTRSWIPDHVQLVRREGACAAHIGTPGESSTCGIYANRPGPCRALAASWDNGEPNESCDRARASIGLPPLPRPIAGS
ncbi:MAG: YkgJ family cysteine cluster protein [Deltaproteobacteria bacterium]|nr:MAG: YkgJ family cysteine cluster protein [Deltaproteobacteria bacterium]